MSHARSSFAWLPGLAHRRAVRPVRHLMRALALTLATGALGCGDGLPPRPDLARLATLPIDAQCRAVAPRLAPCTNELIVASVRDLGDDELTKELAKELAEHDRRLDRRLTSARNGRAAALTFCLGAHSGPAFVATVVGCWERPSCADLASCLFPPAPPPP